jgi:hypothetical protein
MGVITGSITKTSATTTSISFSWDLTTTATGLIFAQVLGNGQVFLLHDGAAQKPFVGNGTLTGLQPSTAYSFIWGAQDSDGANGDGSYSFSTDAPPVSNPPVWTDNTLAAFVANTAYSDGVSATNSPTYAVISGSLPSGISLNTNSGAVTGTPTTAGQSYSFTLRAANNDGNVTQAFSGTVGTPVPVWTDNTLAGFQNGTAYSDAVSATNSPTYSVTVGSLPTGISLNTSTGAVTGTPTVANQSYSFTIRAINAGGNVTQAFSGTVAASGKFRVWNGSAWVYGTPRTWNGSTWATGTIRVWNGSAWVTGL